MQLNIYSDGGARGNPGPAAIGVVVCDESHAVVYEHKDTIGTATNNVAEYLALIAAYEIVKTFHPTVLSFHLDSELVVRQMRGEYKVKHDNMKKLFTVVKENERLFPTVSYTHLPREHEFMRKADKLVNDALDGR